MFTLDLDEACRPVPFLPTCDVQRFVSLLLIILGFSATGAQLKVRFSDLLPGPITTNFQSVVAGEGPAGDWQIVSEEAPSGLTGSLMPQATPTPSNARHSVLAQLSQDPTDEHFPILVYTNETFKNFKLATQFKIVGGTVEQMAGVVFRYQNPSNFYVVRASALGHNLRFYKVVNGARGNILGPDVDLATNTWHTLVVQCEGDEINFGVDGKAAMAPLHDLSFSSGQVGFWTKSDAVSYFGDLGIEFTPLVSGAQLLVRDVIQKYPRILGLRIYMADDNGEPRVVASKDETEVGQPGTDSEKKTLQDGSLFYGKGKGTVAVDYPLKDRNGEVIGAVRVQLKSYALAETQDTVVTRAKIIVDEMQKSVFSKDDLK